MDDSSYVLLRKIRDQHMTEFGREFNLDTIDALRAIRELIASIRAEARTEALWDAGSRAVEYVFFEGDNDPVDGNGFNAPMISSDGLRAAIANAEKPPCA